jgi:hypothetical protein
MPVNQKDWQSWWINAAITWTFGALGGIMYRVPSLYRVAAVVDSNLRCDYYFCRYVMRPFQDFRKHYRTGIPSFRRHIACEIVMGDDSLYGTKKPITSRNASSWLFIDCTVIDYLEGRTCSYYNCKLWNRLNIQIITGNVTATMLVGAY